MHTTEELIAWTVVAATIAAIVCLYLGWHVGWRNGARRESVRQSYVRAELWRAREARLAAERAKRDARGRYIPQARRPF